MRPRADMTPRQLFDAAALPVLGPVPWREPVPERGPGVYVIARVASADSVGERLDAEAVLREERPARLWLPTEPVIYIGKATSLRERLNQFYRHRYGDRSPHRGGQDVLLLSCPLWIDWSAVAVPEAAERAMLGHFKLTVGARPFANRLG